MTKSLSANPSLTSIRYEARQLLKSHKAGDEAACETLRLHARFAGKSNPEILEEDVTLQEVQHALAVDYGFRGWAELRNQISPDPAQMPTPELHESRVGSLQSAIRNGDRNAIARFRDTHPMWAGVPDDTIAAHAPGWHCEFVIARENGFAGPIHMRRHIAEGRPLPPEGSLKEFEGMVRAADTEAVKSMLRKFPHLARARLYDDGDYAECGTTLLHPIARLASDDNENIGSYLEIAAEINASGNPPIGNSPLGTAGWLGHHRMFQFLLDRGADPNHVTPDWGFDALGTTADHQRPEMVEAIIAAGGRVEPRHLLQSELKERLIEALDQEPDRLDELVDIGHFDGDRGTLLHVAIFEVLEEMVALLLERGSDVNAVDNRGRTSLHLALMQGNRGGDSGIITLLIDHGAEIDITAAIGLDDRTRLNQMILEDPSLIHAASFPNNKTLLHIAVDYDKPDIIQELLDQNADAEAESLVGTPLSLAEAKGRDACAEVLRNARK